MELKFINPFSEEFLKENKQHQDLKNDNDDALVIISYHRNQADK